MSIDLEKTTIDDLLSRLGNAEHHVTILGSTTSNGWTPTVAWNPIDVFEVASESVTDSTASLEAFISQQQSADRLCIGFLSYDFGRILHRVPATNTDDLQTPIALVYSFDNWVTFSESGSTIHAKEPTFPQEVEKIMSRPARPIAKNVYRKELFPAWSQQSYRHAYQKVHDYIRAGDIYQANLTHRLEGKTGAYGIDIYRKVSRTSNADFQSYISGRDFEVISGSPERFVRIADGTIETSPVKGTRPRGKNAVDDEAIRLDLESSPKDQAELNMITDLMRNDLGVVSEIGSVSVADERILTSYPTLWHAHSTIQSRLRPDISSIAALASLMPGGSISGTPKKRAVEIIDEIEQYRRGIYTGSIFVVQSNGDLDSNIAIRTMIKKNDDIYLSVGGGIVYDSRQDDEYKESLQKAAVFTNL